MVILILQVGKLSTFKLNPHLNLLGPSVTGKQAMVRVIPRVGKLSTFKTNPHLILLGPSATGKQAMVILIYLGWEN